MHNLHVIIYFQFKGLLLDLCVPSPWDPEGEPSHFVCINPQALIHAICIMHVDDPRKSFRILSQRFWPQNSGFNKPGPSVLVSVLEDILLHGFIREAILPILWQV